MENLKNFMEYINSQEEFCYAEKRGKILAFERLTLWESLIAQNIETWDKELLLNLCENGVELTQEHYISSVYTESKLTALASGICHSGYYGLNFKIGHMNYIFTYLNREDLKLNITDFKVKSRIDNLFSKQEIIDICDALANAQDKFIVYALFSGIRGSKYVDLFNVKTQDVDFENKTITLPSKKVLEIDPYFEEILKDLNTEHGLLYFKINKSGNYNINDYYEFNPDSEYLLKVRPTKSNNFGIGTMSFQGLQTRLQALSQITQLPIKGLNIYRSGVIHRMHEVKKEWKQSEIESFIKENEYHLTAYETQRAFEDKYIKNEK